MATPPFEHHPSGGAEEPAEAERLCPRCGAPYDEYQEYCLECGLRLVPLPGSARRELWARDSPVGLWLALAVLLLVALVAGAVAVAAANDDQPEGSPVVATGPQTTDTIGTLSAPATVTIGPPTTTTDAAPTTETAPQITTIEPTTTAATTTRPATTTTSATTTSPPPSSGALIPWPSGQDGFSVFLRSTRTSDGRGEAEAAGQRAINAGLPEVGVLDSSDYSSLRSGYYVTFTGIYDTLNEAEAALPRARSAGFPLAYVREVAN